MKASLFRIVFLSTAFLLLVSFSATATHLRAGEITVRRDACNSLKFYITVTVFTNTLNTNVLFGGDDDILDFGDGSDPDGDGKIGVLVPETQNTLRPDLGEGIATAQYEIAHIYAAGSSYTISYSEPNRNEGVVNMDRSVDTRFYIETEIIVDPFFGCNQHTPTLAVPPIDRGCVGVAWFHNPGAFDLDGDSLSYEMVVPFRDRNTTVVNYKDPDNPKFYENFATGSENGTPPKFGINAVDGTITWDAPGAAGEYNIAFIIKEWRNIRGHWIQMGFVRRDMQIIIEDCENQRPDLLVPDDICIEAGQTLDEVIIGTDPDNDKVKIEAFSEIFQFAGAQSPATISPKDPVYADQPAEIKFHWETECSHIKEQPYQVVFKITDNSTRGAKLVTFKTWLIRVVGPKPTWPDDNGIAVQTDLTNRSVKLTWDKYFCQNAERMQIWRRVDSLAFEPDTCQTGMPQNLGYTLIKQLAIKDTLGNSINTYTDTNHGKGLPAASVFCYRLVAIFPAPRGGESPVSKEVCIPAILADAPIITNVTVDRTGASDGQITVKWIAPFEFADPTQFPPPYTYEVYRAEGFSGDANITKIPLPTPQATAVVDVGLNTESKIYNYRINAKASNGNPLDTSAVASSVRLDAKSQLNKIELLWTAEVPWSNEVPGLRHKIYRGDEGATTLAQLTLIDSVDVLSTGFNYPDTGQYNGVPLVGSQVYCYVVETLGAYGNDNEEIKSKEPFHNFSQIVCTQPGDETPPCKPETPVPDQPRDCSAYVADISTCNNNVFTNVIKWNRASDDCGNDVAFYRVYSAASSDGEFLLWAEVRDTVFRDENLTSFAKCYKISAVDRSGNESELSDPVCLDNCPYYELPNIFSPNNDHCNDVFSAYNNRPTGGESGEENVCVTTEASKERCARFVNDVTFKVYNRWGKQVYFYTTIGTADRTIYIDWDGRATDGTDLSAGVYYYIAQVKFNSVDPAKQNQTIKGWVHVVK
jgi:hypothetical protein